MVPSSRIFGAFMMFRQANGLRCWMALCLRSMTNETDCLPRDPEPLRWAYLEVSPPSDLVAKPMQIPMVLTAQGHGVLITDLASEGSWLCKFQVMGIAGRASADETWLRRDEGEMGLVPPPHLFAYREDCFGCRWLLPCGGRPMDGGVFVF